MEAQQDRKVKLAVSPQAAALLKTATGKDEKLKIARGEFPLDPHDRVAVLLILYRDTDREVKECCLRGLQGLGDDDLLAVCSLPDAHPRILDSLARLHRNNAVVAARIASHPNIDEKTLLFLAAGDVESTRELLHCRHLNASATVQDGHAAEKAEMDEELAGGDESESKSKFQICQELGVTEKIKLALTGDKEWRSLLLKDNNKMVSEAVLKNPRITDQEILLICKSSVKSDEIIRTISANKEWTKNHSIRKALIENHRTPLPSALRFLSYLTEKELAFLAKNKNVSSVITTQAKRMLIQKKTGK